VLPKFLKPYQISNSNLVRIGPKTDGGYVVDKRIFKKSKMLITCGLNDDWEFERDYLKKNHETQIIAYDHTVNKKFWVNRFKKDIISLLLFKKLKIGKILDVFKYLDYMFFFRNNIKHHEKKIVYKKRNNKETTIPETLNRNNDVVLKVDIEGDEYKVLNDIKKNSKKISFLIIELHDIHKNLGRIRNFIKKSDLKIIHIHANNYGGIDKNKNPKVIELSMINSKKFKINKILSKRRYPVISLDYKNFKRRDDIKIEFNE